MSEYERITSRVGKGIAVKETSFNDNKSIFNAIERLAELEDKIERGELVENNVITHVNMARSGSKTLIAKALAYDELKAKIEQGTLVERPPIKKGDSIWVIRKYWDYFEGRTKKSLERRVVDKIFLNNDNSFTVSTLLIVKGTKHRSVVKSNTFMKSWFLTPEEAEKRLKELQG